MPPTNSQIPPEILQRFNTLQTTKDQIDRDIARLRELPGPFSVQQELTSVVREAVKAFQRDIESLRNAADDQDYQLVRRAVLDNLTKHEEQLKMLQISSREAILRSKQNADAQTRIDRELLFAPSRQPGKDEDEQSDLRQRKGMSVEEAILRKHSDVTEQLQRTTKLMEEEVEKSEVTTRVLADSSRTLSATRTAYTDLSGVVQSSRQAITKLEQSDWLDRILLGLGLLVFLGVVLYVIKRRTWDVGVSWAGWVVRTTGADRVGRVLADKVTEVATEGHENSEPMIIGAAGMTGILDEFTRNFVGEEDPEA